jgi:glutamate N-acetyltransferase/amino-acid N-acetyltransferase
LVVVFEAPVAVAGVFTKSSLPAACVTWCRDALKNGRARGLVVNAGNANAFTGKAGEETVLKTAEFLAEKIGCSKDEIFVSSTGVIGEYLDDKLITSGIDKALLSISDVDEPWNNAASAIMTTDTRPKLVRKTCMIGDKLISLVGFAKGSGMIAPNMATMLSYIFTDANIKQEALQQILRDSVNTSFNAITVDSDQSTNDTVLLFATGSAENAVINNSEDSEGADFRRVLGELCLELAKMIVIDGEGAKKLIEIEITGAANKSQAKEVGFAIANSPLVKTAIAAADPNWGRIVMAIGKSCKATSPEKIVIKIGDYEITRNGQKSSLYNEELVHQYLKNDQVKIWVDLAVGDAIFKVFGCDLNEEYIRINKDYRS